MKKHIIIVTLVLLTTKLNSVPGHSVKLTRLYADLVLIENTMKFVDNEKIKRDMRSRKYKKLKEIRDECELR